MTEYILPERKPAVSLIWSSEPDKSQHDDAVGSDLSNTAIIEADVQFGNLLTWLEQTGRAADTDVLVISDHGYSTITQTVNVEALLREAGFPPGGETGGVVVAQQWGFGPVLHRRQWPGHCRTTGAVVDVAALVRNHYIVQNSSRHTRDALCFLGQHRRSKDPRDHDVLSLAFRSQ